MNVWSKIRGQLDRSNLRKPGNSFKYLVDYSSSQHCIQINSNGQNELLTWGKHDNRHRLCHKLYIGRSFKTERKEKNSSCFFKKKQKKNNVYRRRIIFDWKLCAVTFHFWSHFQLCHIICFAPFHMLLHFFLSHFMLCNIYWFSKEQKSK